MLSAHELKDLEVGRIVTANCKVGVVTANAVGRHGPELTIRWGSNGFTDDYEMTYRHIDVAKDLSVVAR